LLSLEQLTQQRRPARPLPSLKQQYQEYLLQRIESFKNSLARDELLALGDEAARELHTGTAGQFLLTEILMLETVDRLIQKQLRLPSYKKWRKQFLAMSEAQRQPVHWGIDPAGAVAHLLPRVEPMDNVLVIGRGVQAEACLLAAHQAEVTFVDEDLVVVEQLESRIAGESLGGQFMAYVASLGEWLPPIIRELHMAIVDATTLAGLTHANRTALLLELRNLTCPGGVNVIVPGEGRAAPEGYLSHYPDWDREPLGPTRRGKAARTRGVIMSKP
jgi:hypothetical protein